MSVVLKRHYWGFKRYDTRTGKYQGEKIYHSDGRVSDWRGRYIPQEPKRGKGE